MDREKFLRDLREYWIKNTIPNISDVNTKFLVDLIKVSKCKNLLEIWTANWYSAINFGIELEKVNWKIVSIDFSEKSYLEALENIREVWLENTISLILWNALDEIPKLENNSFDFIFIDGMMRRSKDFLELSWSKLKNWWIIIIDDVIKFKEKMVWLWEYLEEKNINFNVLPIDEDDGVMMIVKWWSINDIFDKWNLLKKRINKNNRIKSFKQREIWFTNLWKNIWIESCWKWKDFMRPVLIYKKINKNCFIWIQLTTKKKDDSFSYKIKVRGVLNYINFSQLKTFSSKRLWYKIWDIEKNIFIKIKNKFINYLKK